MVRFEITRIQRGGRTGRRISIVQASSKREALAKLARQRRLPKRVRIFPVSVSRGATVRIVKGGRRKVRKPQTFSFAGFSPFGRK